MSPPAITIRQVGVIVEAMKEEVQHWKSQELCGPDGPCGVIRTDSVAVTVKVFDSLPLAMLYIQARCMVAGLKAAGLTVEDME